MNPSIRVGLIFSTLLTACSVNVPTVSDFDFDAGVTPTDDGSAVAAQPLVGSIQGTTFTAKVALAKASFGRRQITIYEQDASCSNVPKLADGRAIFFTPESWADGATSALSASRPATFFIPPGSNIMAGKGRIEVITVGTDKVAGSIRIRATYSDDTKVEGEVPVYTCAE